VNPPRAVTGVLADADMEYLRTVAKNIITEPGIVALLGSESNGNIVMAKSEGVPGDMTELLRESVAPLGGKGGGSKDFAQGSVPEGSSLHRVLKHAADRVTKPVPVLHVVSRHPSGGRAQPEIWQSKGKARR
jgi:alanyl-tRNA synthetase